ncbi:MAG: hypothetical protein J1E39_06985 [Eubacterium sp.]|nr:hypothetical protein [Eubacterium sp.]
MYLLCFKVISVIVNDSIVQAYLKGNSIEDFHDEWYFTHSTVAGQIGKNIFTVPDDSIKQKAKVHVVYASLYQAAGNFEPINMPIWDALFANWRETLETVQVDLILGFPEPFDATVERDDGGVQRIIFDMSCWTKYLGRCDIAEVARNLLTHELCHVLIGKQIPQIDEDMKNTDYHIALDALTFHEAFAHLVSYDAKEIGDVDWDTPKLAEVRKTSNETMRNALRELDKKEQERYLYTAQCGDYYEKYACMSGMLYLAALWQRGGVSALKACFDEGYIGFAEKCSEEV